MFCSFPPCPTRVVEGADVPSDRETGLPLCPDCGSFLAEQAPDVPSPPVPVALANLGLPATGPGEPLRWQATWGRIGDEWGARISGLDPSDPDADVPEAGDVVLVRSRSGKVQARTIESVHRFFQGETVALCHLIPEKRHAR